VKLQEDERIDDFANRVFTYLYHEDIEEQRSMEDKWKDREKPCSITTSSSNSSSDDHSTSRLDCMKVLSVQDNINIFKSTLKALKQRLTTIDTTGDHKLTTVIMK
ncbi:hypothetical protein RFI_12281, partial [Reticulomyxa filosa]